MRPALLLVPLVLLSNLPAVAAVSDDALLSLRPMSLDLRERPGNDLYRYQVGVHVQATDDAPAGTIRARLELQLSSYLGGEVRTQARDLTVQYPGSRQYTMEYSNTSYATFDWTLEPGMYMLSLNLTDPAGSSTWDSGRATLTVGESPSLRSGWGAASVTGPEMDLDEDGLPDVRLQQTGTGEPAPWRIDARTFTGIANWENRYYRSLAISFWGSPRNRTTDATVSIESIRKVLSLRDDQYLHAESKDLAEEPTTLDGQFRFRLPVGGADSYLFPEVRFQYVVDLGRPFHDRSSWSDGFRTYVNVTQWDMDEDGWPDMRFYNGSDANATIAREQEPMARREQPMTLYAMVRIEHRSTRRILTFDFERIDGLHGPAWIEVANASRILRRLLDEYAGAHNTTIRYEFDLPGHEAFVQEFDNRTWIWIGHFSTQTLRVILDYDSGMVVEPEETKKREPDLIAAPSLRWPLAIMAVAVLLLRRTR